MHVPLLKVSDFPSFGPLRRSTTPTTNISSNHVYVRGTKFNLRTLPHTDPFYGIDVGQNAAPFCADFDSDKKLDCVVGTNTGTIAYYRNNGTVDKPAYQLMTGSQNPFNGFNAGTDAKPFCADWHGTGRLDCIIGRSDGTIAYYRNNGTATAPSFEHRVSAGSLFHGIDVGKESVPFCCDFDGDGDLDCGIVSGHGEDHNKYGQISYYLNVGNASSPDYQPQTGSANIFNTLNLEAVAQISSGMGCMVDCLLSAMPFCADFNSDGVLDIATGEPEGDVKFYPNLGSTIAPAFPRGLGLGVSGNPFNGVQVQRKAAPFCADFDNDVKDEFSFEFGAWWRGRQQVPQVNRFIHRRCHTKLPGREVNLLPFNLRFPRMLMSPKLAGREVNSLPSNLRPSTVMSPKLSGREVRRL